VGCAQPIGAEKYFIIYFSEKIKIKNTRVEKITQITEMVF